MCVLSSVGTLSVKNAVGILKNICGNINSWLPDRMPWASLPMPVVLPLTGSDEVCREALAAFARHSGEVGTIPLLA